MRGKAAHLTLFLLLCLILIGLRSPVSPTAAQDVRPQRVTVTGVDLLGQASIPVGSQKENTEIGGLSAITYDSIADRYYVLSDDRSERNPARFYKVAVDLSGGVLTNAGVNFESVTTLLATNGQPFPAGGIDPEGIALSPQGTLFISSEGALQSAPPIAPSVNEFEGNGQQIRTLTIPAKFLPDDSGTVGVRNNLSFESLTFSPSARVLYTAVENALLQDGPEAGEFQPSLARFIAFDSQTGNAVAETAYLVGPAAASVSPTIPHGLVEAIALDNNGTFLTLERGPSNGLGLSVRLFLTRMQGALDAATLDDLVWDEQGIPYTIDQPAGKELLIDFADLGLPYVNNYEGMALGPVLTDGRQTLVLVSDNNFSILPSEFLALALTLEAVPAAIPSLETALTYDVADPPQGIVAGDPANPAIWLHPEDPSQSLVAVTLRDGGLQILNLAGEVLQSVFPLVYGDVHYNDVDVVYNFTLGDKTVDLFVVADRRNDTLAVLRIDPVARQVTDITAIDMPGTLFGVDDGDRTAYGLATFASPRDGRVYAYVTQANGNLIAQVALAVDANDRVSGTVVRTLALPITTGVTADSQAEGIVVDRLLGSLYVGMGAGVMKFDAEPDGDSNAAVVQAGDDPDLTSTISGLAIYYGPGRTGYLLASSRRDQSYAVYGRDGDNPYIGRFIISDEGYIDQVNDTVGIDLSNVSLDANFPNGLMVVHDGVNEPQNLIADGGTLRNNSSNFKLVRWDSVANAFPEPLQIDTGSFNPRHSMRLFLPTVSGN